MVWKELNRSAAANLASIIKYKEAKFSFKSDRLWYAYELFRNKSLKSTNSEMLMSLFCYLSSTQWGVNLITTVVLGRSFLIIFFSRYDKNFIGGVLTWSDSRLDWDVYLWEFVHWDLLSSGPGRLSRWPLSRPQLPQLTQQRTPIRSAPGQLTSWIRRNWRKSCCSPSGKGPLMHLRGLVGHWDLEW
jgi:hypothetical protein